jgi:hypothetical protein
MSVLYSISDGVADWPTSQEVSPVGVLTLNMRPARAPRSREAPFMKILFERWGQTVSVGCSFQQTDRFGTE